MRLAGLAELSTPMEDLRPGLSNNVCSGAFWAVPVPAENESLTRTGSIDDRKELSVVLEWLNLSGKGGVVFPW